MIVMHTVGPLVRTRTIVLSFQTQKIDKKVNKRKRDTKKSCFGGKGKIRKTTMK